MLKTSVRRAAHLLVATLVLLAGRPAAAAWPQFGGAVAAASGSQAHPVITTDGADGALIAWQDARTAPGVIAVHHLRATGDLDPAWPRLGRAVLAFPLVNPSGGQLNP